MQLPSPATPTRQAAYQIIQREGAAYWAKGAGLTRVAEAAVRDQKKVLSVSSLIEDSYGISDICLSLPTLVDRSGVALVLRLDLGPKEVEELRRSARVPKAKQRSWTL
jgi:L-lactate dehydrogenase